MRKRLRQMAIGKFEYQKPVISFSENTIDFEVIEDEDYYGEFVISCENHMPLRGIVYSTNERMECLTPQFEGEEVVIRYQFHGKGLIESELVKGQFVIVFNQGEYSLDFCATISKFYMDSSLGLIKNLYEFANLAKESWDEAYQLFYHKSFANIIRPNEVKELMIYKALSSGRPCNQNLEEFLVGIGKKEAVNFELEENEVTYSNISEKRMNSLSIKKDNWGYIEIEVSSDSKIIDLSRKKITSDDFMGSRMDLEYLINTDELHSGLNYCRITLSASRSEKTFDITIDNTNESLKRNHEREDEIRECKVGIMELYQAYRLKRIVTGVWANETIDILNHLQALLPDEDIYKLMKAQAYIINRQRQEAIWILEEYKNSDVDKKTPVYGYYLYLETLLEREPSFVDKLTREIEIIFHENPDSVLLFWVLSFLQEEYYNNNSHKLKAIEYWCLKGSSSPYLYLEAYYLIWQDPYLLVKMGTFEKRVLRWAVRRKAMTKDIAIQIFLIMEKEKAYDETKYFLMCEAYKIMPKPEYVGIICSYLIKNQIYDNRFHQWFLEGINNNLRITGLYEAYLMSLDDRKIVEVPKIIELYFQYDTKLPYKKMAVLYNNIIAAKNTSPKVYEKYKKAMGNFAMEQVEACHIDDNLAVLYKDMLDLGLLNEELARSLSHIIFTNKLMVNNPKFVRAIIFQRELKDAQIVPITDSQAYFELYSKDYVIVFEDMAGNRYLGDNYAKIQALMEPEIYLDKCMNLAYNCLSYVLKHFEKKKNYLNFDEDDKVFFRRILSAGELSPEYQKEIIPEIFRFYKTSTPDGSIERYLTDTDVRYMEPELRRFLIEEFVEYGMYEKSFDYIKDFGYESLSPTQKICLANNLLETRKDTEDERLLALILSAFNDGKYTKETIEYLNLFYNGPTELMIAIQKSLKEYEINALSIEERIISQIVYSDSYVDGADCIFKDYYKDGGRENIVLAYLSYRAHDNFVNDLVIDDFIFEMIEARYANEMDLNDACKLALLRFYSELEKLDDKRYEIADQLLSEYTCRNMLFAFYKKLDYSLVLKYHLYDKVFIEYKSNPRNHVILHYSRDDDEDNYRAEDMVDMYEGIFVKTFVMFFSDMLSYYISDEYQGQVTVTKSNRITNNDVYGHKDKSRYSLINEMLISMTLMDEQTLYNDMKQYDGFDRVTRKIFKIM